MARWKRILERMRASVRCVEFTYEEAEAVLRGLGFDEIDNSGTSHRRFQKLLPGEPRVIIGLVKKGHGELKPVYIKEMLRWIEHVERVEQAAQSQHEGEK